jgi:hypothetical protein
MPAEARSGAREAVMGEIRKGGRQWALEGAAAGAACSGRGGRDEVRRRIPSLGFCFFYGQENFAKKTQIYNLCNI